MPNINRNIVHGHSQRGKKTPEYYTWVSMRQRCNNPRVVGYKNYGGRGIKVCEAWKDFLNFFADMGPRPEGLTLDRKDNNGNYEPGNCCWATRKEQNNNKRVSFFTSFFYGHGPNNEMIIWNSQTEIAKIFKLDKTSICRCVNNKLKIHKGWRFQIIWKTNSKIRRV